MSESKMPESSANAAGTARSKPSLDANAGAAEHAKGSPFAGIELPGRYLLRNGSHADITEFLEDSRGGVIVGTQSVHVWDRSGRHAGTPSLYSIGRQHTGLKGFDESDACGRGCHWLGRSDKIGGVKLTPEIIHAAIMGLEAQKLRIDVQIAELLRVLAPAQAEAAPVPSKKTRRFSAEARARMASAQKKRWAEMQEPAKETEPPVVRAKRKISAEGRANIVAALKKRHAAAKRDKKTMGVGA